MAADQPNSDRRAGSETVRHCPTCGLYNPWHPDTPPDAPTCNPLRSPDCWTYVQKYDHDLRRWVLTEEGAELQGVPGEERSGGPSDGR